MLWSDVKCIACAVAWTHGQSPRYAPTRLCLRPSTDLERCQPLTPQAGPSHNMNWYYPDGNTTVPAGPRGTDPDAMNGNAVMYDAVNGKILTVAGAPIYTVRARPVVPPRRPAHRLQPYLR